MVCLAENGLCEDALTDLGWLFEQRPVLDPNQSSCAHSFLIKVTLRKSPKPFSISSLKSLRSSLSNGLGPSVSYPSSEK